MVLLKIRYWNLHWFQNSQPVTRLFSIVSFLLAPDVLLILARAYLKLGNGRTALFGVLYLSVITEICGYGTGTAKCAMRLRGSDTSYGVRSDDLAYLAFPTLTVPDTHLPSIPHVLLLYCFIIQLLALAACFGCLNSCRFC
jgi:hypothetical protein